MYTFATESFVDPFRRGWREECNTFLLGVTQGSTINISSQGVYIGTRASKTSGGGGADSADTTAESTTQVGPNRILAAWDADGLALERIDTLGNVPDPQANETMTVAYDTPHAALRFKIRERIRGAQDHGARSSHALRRVRSDPPLL